MIAPLLALAAFVHENPNYRQLAAKFDEIAQDLLEVRAICDLCFDLRVI